MIDFESPGLNDGHERLETERFIAVWRGFLFVRGCVAGADSVARLLDALESQGPAQAFALAKGAFASGVLDKRSGAAFFAVDPFGLMRLFVAGDLVSDDLVGLIRRLGYADDELDRAGLASFVRFGFYNLGRTIDRRIRALAGDEIVHRPRGGNGQRIAKAFPAAAAAAFDFDAYLSDVRTAVEGQRVSLDLTGGHDSRLLAACFKQVGAGIAECATMGRPAQQDLTIARNVAQGLKLPHASATHDAAGFEGRVLALLRVTNGQLGLATYDHAYQFGNSRLERGMTLAISGVGGEVWKDFWWLQDYPFLGGRPNFDWLYATRIEARKPATTGLSPSFEPAFDAAKVDYLAAMRERFGGLGRTQAYDSVYAFLRIPSVGGPWVTASILSGLPTFCPLLDLDGVIASIGKPKSERMFAAWHRKTISRAAPEIAALKATDGLSARAGVAALSDLPSYLHNKAARFAQKVAQRLGLPDVVDNALFEPGDFRTAKTYALAAESLERLAGANVVTRGVEPGDLPFALFDRLLTAGLTISQASPRETA